MSDDGGLWLLLLGPAGAAGFYWAMYRHYRNTDKSHAYERETKIEGRPPSGSDFKVDTVTGTRETRIRGAGGGGGVGMAGVGGEAITGPAPWP